MPEGRLVCSVQFEKCIITMCWSTTPACQSLHCTALHGTPLQKDNIFIFKYSLVNFLHFVAITFGSCECTVVHRSTLHWWSEWLEGSCHLSSDCVSSLINTYYCSTPKCTPSIDEPDSKEWEKKRCKWWWWRLPSKGGACCPLLPPGAVPSHRDTRHRCATPFPHTHELNGDDEDMVIFCWRMITSKHQVDNTDENERWQ